MPDTHHDDGGDVGEVGARVLVQNPVPVEAAGGEGESIQGGGLGMAHGRAATEVELVQGLVGARREQRGRHLTNEDMCYKCSSVFSSSNDLLFPHS